MPVRTMHCATVPPEEWTNTPGSAFAAAPCTGQHKNGRSSPTPIAMAVVATYHSAIAFVNTNQRVKEKTDDARQGGSDEHTRGRGSGHGAMQPLH